MSKNINSLHAVIIKIENLNLCRSFYRDVLNLGTPVMDSNFWVEFKINDHASLILEQLQPGGKLPPTHGRISWMCEVDNLAEYIKHLDDNGHAPSIDETECLGKRIAKFMDPEGNPFTICEINKEK